MAKLMTLTDARAEAQQNANRFNRTDYVMESALYPFGEQRYYSSPRFGGYESGYAIERVEPVNLDQQPNDGLTGLERLDAERLGY